ncbi:MAG: DUF3078 domain-containing protein [Bacteroidota bacterium]|nr:DUF3078 domain-containing protein [Bacteroidota bacterium]
MKRYFILYFAFILVTPSLIAQQADTSKTSVPKRWSKKTDIIITMEQTQIDNWSAGGYSNFTFGSFLKGYYNYLNGKHKLDNTLELSYGRTRQDISGDGIWDNSNRWKKSDDKVELNSIYGYKAVGNWNYSVLLNLKSQFDNGYKNDTILISAGLSPATLTSSAGLEYKKKYFSVLFSFLTGKTVYVLDKRLRGRSLGYSDEIDDAWKFSLGSYIKLFYNRDITKNINILCKMDFFYDYEKPLIDTDISGEVFVTFKIFKYLSTFFDIQMVMDKDFSTDLQFKERFGISIPFTF